MILTQNKYLAKKVKYISTTAKDDPIKFIHNDSGYNLRLNNICAAIGLSQSENFAKILLQKEKIYKNYKNNFVNFNNATIFTPPAYAKSNQWLILIKINKSKIIKVLKVLNKQNIQADQLKLNHLQNPSIIMKIMICIIAIICKVNIYVYLQAMI